MTTNKTTTATRINRRHMLLGLMAASSAAAATTAVAVAAPRGTENAELLRLGDELAALETGYVAARKHQDDVARTWAPKWPLAPDAITTPGRKSWWGNIERTFYGGALLREGEEHPRQLITSQDLEWRISNAERALKSKRIGSGQKASGRDRQEWETELEECRRLLPVASAYEGETKCITEAANYTAAWKAVEVATKALSEHVASIMAQPDETMEGLLIKAEALASWGRVKSTDQLWAIYVPHNWHGQIAASILRHAGAVS